VSGRECSIREIHLMKNIYDENGANKTFNQLEPGAFGCKKQRNVWSFQFSANRPFLNSLNLSHYNLRSNDGGASRCKLRGIRINKTGEYLMV
jgi:hypothetical protein